MLNFKNGNFQRYFGNDKPLVNKINGRWIHFKVVHRGPQRKIDVYYGENLETKITYDVNGSDAPFGFKYGAYGTNPRSTLHNKMEVSYKEIKVHINRKFLTLE